MQVIIRPIDIELTQQLKEYIQQRLHKFFGKHTYITSIDVYVKYAEEREETPHIIEAKVFLPGPELFADSAASTYQTALNETIDKLRRQLEKYKEKFHSKRPNN